MKSPLQPERTIAESLTRPVQEILCLEKARNIGLIWEKVVAI